MVQRLVIWSKLQSWVSVLDNQQLVLVDKSAQQRQPCLFQNYNLKNQVLGVLVCLV